MASEADPSASLFAGMAATGIEFRRAPTAEQAAQAPSHDAGPVYLWPEAEPAWRCFVALRDQWRDGVLPRSEVLAHLQATVPCQQQRMSLYHGVCACIGSVVQVYAEHRRKRQRQQQAPQPVMAAARH